MLWGAMQAISRCKSWCDASCRVVVQLRCHGKMATWNMCLESADTSCGPLTLQRLERGTAIS